jgi:secondary thiamine-phosphate synthase enzyme
MKSHRKIIELRTEEREEIVNISREVHAAVRASGIQEGLCLVYPLHTSSAVFLNDSDSSVTLDTADVLRRLVPAAAGYRHDDVDPKANADGHIKQVLVGHHLVLPVTEGALDFGTYQTVYYAEFDGGRVKEVLVKIIGA